MDESNFKIDVLYVYIDKKRKYTQNCKEKLNKYSHSQWLFYEFVSKITNNLVKQSLRVTVDELQKDLLSLNTWTWHFIVTQIWRTFKLPAAGERVDLNSFKCKHNKFVILIKFSASVTQLWNMFSIVAS